MMGKENFAVTVDEFASLVACELELTGQARAELARRAESVLTADVRWSVPAEPQAYYMDDAFRSMREISREEAAAMMAYASELAGGHVQKLSSIEVVRTLASYKDAKLVSAWAMPALATAVQYEWMGCHNDEIKPKHFVSPLEAAIMVKRFAMDIQ